MQEHGTFRDNWASKYVFIAEGDICSELHKYSRSVLVNTTGSSGVKSGQSMIFLAIGSVTATITAGWIFQMGSVDACCSDDRHFSRWKLGRSSAVLGRTQNGTWDVPLQQGQILQVFTAGGSCFPFVFPVVPCVLIGASACACAVNYSC